MLMRFLFVVSLVCAVSLSSCCGSPKDHGNVAVRVGNHQEITGKWASIVTEQGFGSLVLVWQFDSAGRYSIASVGPLESIPHEVGSRALSGAVEEGRYHIQDDMLYLDRVGASGTQRCTITMREGLLVLAFDENRIYVMMKLEPVTGERNKHK